MLHQTSAPNYERATSLNQHEYHPPYATDEDSTATIVELNKPGEWEVSLFGCSKHLLAALLIPFWNAAYAARGVNKSVFVGLGIAICYYGGIASAVLWATDDDEPSVDVGGMELGLWQNLMTTILPTSPSPCSYCASGSAPTTRSRAPDGPTWASLVASRAARWRKCRRIPHAPRCRTPTSPRSRPTPRRIQYPKSTVYIR